MNCLEIQELLAVYFDGEMADGMRSMVETHLGRCSTCSQSLAGFEQLSTMTRALKTQSALEMPPEFLWSRIEQQLDQHSGSRRVLDNQREPAAPADRSWGWASLAPRLFALAATVIVALGIGSFAHHAWFSHDGHDRFAVEFRQYIEDFRRDPAAAQQVFLAKYESRLIDPRQVIQQVGYRPAVAGGLPEGYALVSTHLVKMPCCTCVQAICKRSDGSTLAIFEHDDDQTAEWFGDRPETTATCHSKQCCLVQLDGQIAASWKQGTRHITMLGVQNVSEVSQLVGWLDKNQPPILN